MRNATQERILLLLQWLQEETNPQHPITSVEILQRWKNLDLPTDRRSVYNDIKVLKKMGYRIHSARSASNAYWMESDRFQKSKYFTIPEIGMLLDAVQSCRCISQDDTEVLIHKLLWMVSKEERGALERPVFTDYAYKESGKELGGKLTILFQAITQRKKILFHQQYYSFRPEIQKCSVRKITILSPYYIHYDREHYQIVGWSEDHGEIRSYRVDRITGIQITKQKSRKRPSGFDPETTGNSIDAYVEALVEITLRCNHDSLMEVIDRYGDQIPLRYLKANQFEAVIQTELSPQFSRWLALNSISIVAIKNHHSESGATSSGQLY